MAHATENNFDISHRSKEIRVLIMNDKISDAGRRLLDFADDFDSSDEYMNEIIVLNNDCTRLLKEERKNTLEQDILDKKRKNILYQILGIVEEISQRKPQI